MAAKKGNHINGTADLTITLPDGRRQQVCVRQLTERVMRPIRRRLVPPGTDGADIDHEALIDAMIVAATVGPDGAEVFAGAGEDALLDLSARDFQALQMRVMEVNGQPDASGNS